MARRGFTLIELLVVITIIAILAAILFPVFAQAKAAAKKAACVSGLSQIGKSIVLYMNDYDDVFPHAIDAADKYAPQIWDPHPEFQARIPYMPMLHEALQPYLKNYEIFKCAGDTGTKVLDNHWPDELISAPSLYAMYGSSYFFRTEIAFKYFTQTAFQLPTNVNVLMDGGGHWHGAGRALEKNDSFENVRKLRRTYRYNTLFGDMHVKSLHYDQLQDAWATPL